jgi:hypothetical protein
MPAILTKPLALAALTLSVLALAACGESSQEKAAKNVCAARNEISAQITKLEGLTFSSSTVKEAEASFEAIGNSLKKIKNEQPALSSQRKEQVQAATQTFQTELSSIASGLVSSLSSGNLEAELKNAEPQLKAALSKLAADYKQALAPISCS